MPSDHLDKGLSGKRRDEMPRLPPASLSPAPRAPGSGRPQARWCLAGGTFRNPDGYSDASSWGPGLRASTVSFLLLPLFRLFYRGEKPMVREVGPPAQSHTARQQQRGDSGCRTLFMKTEVFRNRSLLSFWSGRATCRLLVPRPEIKPVPPAVEAWSPNPLAIREFPEVARFNI